MVKNLEFRAFDLLEKKMCEVTVINLEKGCFLVGNSPTPDKYDEDSIIEGTKEGHFVEFKDLDLMQYTGVKDKDGVKIFVNDIVEYYGTKYLVGEDSVLYDYLDQQEDENFGELGYNHGDNIFELRTHLVKIVGNTFEDNILLKNEKI